MLHFIKNFITNYFHYQYQELTASIYYNDFVDLA